MCIDKGSQAMVLMHFYRLNQIAACHGGNLNDSQYGRRMKGSGEFANQIQSQMELGRKKYLSGREKPALNCELFEQYRPGQLSLF